MGVTRTAWLRFHPVQTSLNVLRRTGAAIDARRRHAEGWMKFHPVQTGVECSAAHKCLLCAAWAIT
jgi:hypothetical protein